MRSWLLLGPVITVLLFGACGDDSDNNKPSDGAADSAIAETGNSDRATAQGGDGSATPDGPPGDASTSDAAATDATPDGALADGEAGADGSPATDGATDGGADGGADGSADAGGFAINSLFDKSGGANTYGNLNAANWVASGTLITANAGAEWFGSGNGNASGTFANLSIKKDLGGGVENKPYTVSFYLSQPDPNQMGVELADFSKLRIGGPNGTVVWTSTVTPTVEDVWIKWTGTYTPAAGDLGGPFYFEATFDLDALHSVGFDGPITAVP